MFRLPSEPSPFASTWCPYDTQARCGRPYCPFVHQNNADVSDAPSTDVIALDEDQPDGSGARSSALTVTEIRQENPADQFSGVGYFGYVSTTEPIFSLNTQPPPAQLVQQQQQPHQQNQQQHIFFPNLPSTNHHHLHPQQQTFALPSFQSTSLPQYGVPPSTAAPFIAPYPLLHQQNVDAIRVPPPHEPIASQTVPPSSQNSSIFSGRYSNHHHSPLALDSAPQFSPIQAQPEAKHHKRPKPTPGGLPAYIPTPIAQLEKEQKEREQRREERKVRKEQQQHAKEEKQSEAREKEQPQQRESAGRGEIVEHEEKTAGSETANGGQRNKAKASTSSGAIVDGGLDIDRIMVDQKQLLDEMSDNRERKMREILRVEAEHERRIHLAKQKTVNKKFIHQSTKTNGNFVTKCPSKLLGPKVKKTIGKKKSATPKKKKLATKNGAANDAKMHKERRTVIKSLIEQEEQQKQQRQEEVKRAEEEERKKKQSMLNDRVKHVAQLDKEIAKIQSELRHSNNKMAMLGPGKGKLEKTKEMTDQKIKTNPSATAAAADKKHEETAKRIPIWRRDAADQIASKSATSFLEDNRFYLATQRHPIPSVLVTDGGKRKKSVDLIVKDLFGEDVEEENRSKTKKRKQQTSADDGMAAEAKKLPLVAKREKKGPKHGQKDGEDEECVRQERQAMIDSIMEENSEEEPLQSVLSPIAFTKKRTTVSPCPSIVSVRSSSVSVVPETPLASPQRVVNNTNDNNNNNNDDDDGDNNGGHGGNDAGADVDDVKQQQKQQLLTTTAHQRPSASFVTSMTTTTTSINANTAPATVVVASSSSARTAAVNNKQPAVVMNQQKQHHHHRRVPSAEEQLHMRSAAAMLAATGADNQTTTDENEGRPPQQAKMKKPKTEAENSDKKEWLTKGGEKGEQKTENNYVPARIPMHHPSQRPAAPKPLGRFSSIVTANSAIPTAAAAAGPLLPSLPSSLSTTTSTKTTITPSSSSSSADPNRQQQPQQRQHKNDNSHVTKSATVPKGGVRKAHTPKFQTSKPSTSAAAPTKSLVPLEPLNRKVPIQLRQRNLVAIHAEYVKIFGNDSTDAIEGAQNEEKLVLERCNGKMGYLAAIPMLIKRLRETAANGQGDGGAKRGDSVSHTSVLLGRHAKVVTCGLHRADRSMLVAQHTNFSETDFYNMLHSEFLLSDQHLWDNGYPKWTTYFNEDDDVIAVEDLEKKRVEIRQSELDAGKSRVPFVDDAVLSRVCDRCGKEYRLTKEGDYAAGASADQCIFHWGRAWKKRSCGTIESRYNCCDQPLTVQGCDVAPHHITQTQRLSTLCRYVDTPRPLGVGDPRSKKVYSLDCEMVYTVWGPEVARLSVVDITGELIFDVIIRPEHRIVDCNTKFSGLKPEQVMAGECDLNEAHQRLFELVNAETILIGHSLESDLRALRLVHRRVVDTSVVFPHRMGPPYKRALKTLAAEITEMIIQDDESGHDSKEDALACMRIMLRKCRTSGGGQ